MDKRLVYALLIAFVIVVMMCHCGAIEWHPENLTIERIASSGRSDIVLCAKNPDLPECRS